MTLPGSAPVSDTPSSQPVPADAGQPVEGLPQPTQACANCKAPNDSFLFVCWRCAKMLGRAFNEVPWLLRRLHESAYGEAKVARQGGPRVSQGECLPSLPLNSRAADLLRDVARLVDMAEQVAGYRPAFADDPNAAEQAARYLATVPGRLMFYPFAPDALAWALQWVADATTAIDLPPDLQYAGPCQAKLTQEITEGGVVIRTVLVGTCRTPLYVDAESLVADCYRCGATWRVEDLQREALQRVDDAPRTAADMWRLLKAVGRDVPRSTFYKLIAGVEAHGYDRDGFPTYVYSAVAAALDLRDELAAERAAAGKAKRGRPRKAVSVDTQTADDVALSVPQQVTG
ncbi:hypothetical protein SEA_CHRIS_74 [Mycobacterium phage Chris]|uniref:Uncharacterized protein n=1 Tax=Mycobacterium phage Chris TaxID=2725626 RepID=A0A6M3SWW7_9CAUD|nr:hypothetical protein I5G96_gp031 [Mycobacterium phage Chris]QJD50476.1 hypothetical protein SEA_CHRIS_74 [Mycobacterium phage Chris]